MLLNAPSLSCVLPVICVLSTVLFLPHECLRTRPEIASDKAESENKRKNLSRMTDKSGSCQNGDAERPRDNNNLSISDPGMQTQAMICWCQTCTTQRYVSLRGGMKNKRCLSLPHHKSRHTPQRHFQKQIPEATQAITIWYMTSIKEQMLKHKETHIHMCKYIYIYMCIYKI